MFISCSWIKKKSSVVKKKTMINNCDFDACGVVVD